MDPLKGKSGKPVALKLTGVNGNAYALMGAAKRAASKAGVPAADIEAVLKEAMAGDYNHLLATLMDAFDVS